MTIFPQLTEKLKPTGLLDEIVLEERLEMDGDKVGADGDTGECVLQCVAVCCSVLQCVAVRWMVIKWAWMVTQVNVCCSVLQRVAACGSVLQRVAA